MDADRLFAVHSVTLTPVVAEMLWPSLLHRLLLLFCTSSRTKVISRGDSSSFMPQQGGTSSFSMRKANFHDYYKLLISKWQSSPHSLEDHAFGNVVTTKLCFSSERYFEEDLQKKRWWRRRMGLYVKSQHFPEESSQSGRGHAQWTVSFPDRRRLSFSHIQRVVLGAPISVSAACARRLGEKCTIIHMATIFTVFLCSFSQSMVNPSYRSQCKVVAFNPIQFTCIVSPGLLRKQLLGSSSSRGYQRASEW